MTASIFEIDPSIPTPDDLRTDPVLSAKADDLYKTSQSGPRTILPCSFCYLPLSDITSPKELSALADRASKCTLIEQISARRLSERRGYIEYIFDVGNWSPFMPSEPGKKYATLLQILQYPFSHGSIHIAADGIPSDKPIINPQYYEGEHGALDLEIQQICARFGQKLMETQPLKAMIQKCASPPENADGEVLRDWLIDNTITDWHPVGTCAMGGRDGAKAGVVDERLRVYGVKGLRVVDASVMPLHISAHPQATIYAIAEKASQMILEDRNAGPGQNGTV